jgi:hypothetical protein
MTHSTVSIHITPTSLPSIPCWMGEVAAFAQVLSHTGILQSIQEQVRFARARFGRYDQLSQNLRSSSRERNVPIGVSVGPSAWHAMPVRLTLLL